MDKIVNWLDYSCLTLNKTQIVCVFFTSRKSITQQPEIIVKGEKLQLEEDFKYLGFIIDSNLTFKKHNKKVHGQVQRNCVISK